jgi:dihydroxy-acid dehydratase
MEDFYYAGGIPAVMKQIERFLNGGALTVTGRTMAENIASAETYNSDVIHELATPFKPIGGIAVLRGNLAPNGAVLKPSAASPISTKAA